MELKSRFIKSKNKIQIGLPSKDVNIRVINTLKKVCASHIEINRCYLFQKGVEHQESPCITIGILFSKNDKNLIKKSLQSIASHLQSLLNEKEQMDLMVLNNNPEIINYLEKNEKTAVFLR